ncbi:MAG: helix-turn-helix transcriptional regulator [Verrucomicrobiae bacterium]|nr:helix-turn-helix transcriptional regulator [Verrucomicrobiae bacterium]
MGLSEAVVPPEIVEACAGCAAKHDASAIPNVGLERIRIEVTHPDNPSRRAVIEPLDASSEPLSQPAFAVRFESPSAQSDGEGNLLLLSHLSTAEKSVADRLLLGESNREIAGALGKSEGTVRKQVESILRKIGVRDRRRLILALRGGGVAG